MTAIDGIAVWTYTYDKDGLRLSRSDGTTTYNYVYLGGQLVYMTIGDSVTMKFNYDANGAPLSFMYNGTTYYYITNLQGDVVGIINQSGTQIVAYTYDAWGNLLDISGTKASTIGTNNLLRYRGYVYDTETGLYYLQSRYYNPEIGRFINADSYVSTGQGLLGNNMFAYCENNPVNRSDPSGEISSVAIIKGLISAFTSISCAILSGERGLELIDDALLGFASGYFDNFGTIYSIYEAIETGIEYAKKTDNAMLGVVAGLTSFGVSLFSGENISNIPGVNEMDEAAEILFDAIFGYCTNIFNTVAWNDVISYFEK